MKLIGRSLFLGTLVSLIVLVSGCPRPLDGAAHKTTISFNLAPNVGLTISKVGPLTITETSFIREFRSLPAYLRQKILKDEMEGKKFLNTQIRKELLFFEAIRRGMLNDFEVQESLKKILVQKITREELSDQKTVKISSDSDLRNYYNQHIERFHHPEKISVMHIFVPFGADRRSSYQKINSVYKKIMGVSKDKRTKDLKNYASVASDFGRYSDKGAHPGVIYFKSREELDQLLGPQIAGAAFGLKKTRDISTIKEGKEGYFIIQSLARKKAIKRSLDEVKKAIEKRLYYENRRKAFVNFIETLESEIGVSTSFEGLARVRKRLSYG